jgi:hypothetical protein
VGAGTRARNVPENMGNTPYKKAKSRGRTTNI